MAHRTPITVTGRLGKDPETRQTSERDYVAFRENKIAEMKDPYDVHIAARGSTAW